MPSFCEPSMWWSTLTRAPVASSAFPNPTSSPPCSFTDLAPVSSDITLRPANSSTPFSSYHSGGWTRASSCVASPRMYSFVSGGRSYGGSGSRPTSRIDPSAPRFRSSAAQCADAIPPPTSRKSTSRSATPAPRLVAVRVEVGLQVVLAPRVEHREHLVARLEHRVRARHEPFALPQHRDQQAPLGHRQVPNPLTGHGRGVGQLQLDDLQALLLQVEQVDEAVLRHLVLDQAQDQV